MDKLRMESPDLVQGNVEKIAALFPNCVTEGPDGHGGLKKVIDFDKLRQMLSGDVLEGDEAYEFTWVGKKAAIVEANKPTRQTLRPCPEESKNWDTTENLYIEGDNLQVLKLLQESYLGKVKMIYIDPPYNTGHDFIYNDHFEMDKDEYEQQTSMFDEEGNRNFTENTDSNPRFHSDWCSMMYSRLMLARNLLTEDGVIFISIDDGELTNITKILSEVFGEENFIACFPRITKKAGKTTDTIAKNHDYVIAFGKTCNTVFYLPEHDDGGFKYTDEYYQTRGRYKLNQTLDYDSLQYSPSLDYPIVIDGETFYPGQSEEKYNERKKGHHGRADWAWRWSKELFDFGYKNGFVVVKKYADKARIYTKTYQNAMIVRNGNGFTISYMQRTKPISSLEFTDNQYSNDNAKKALHRLFESNAFDYSKPVSLIQALVKYTTTNNDIIMDFFSGSGTTAEAVIAANFIDIYNNKRGDRKFIMVQLPERCNKNSEASKKGYQTICDIGKERIRRAGETEYRDIRSTMGNTMRWNEEERKRQGAAYICPEDVDIGFRVFKLADSNMQDVYFAPDDYNQDMLSMMESNIKPDRTALDLLFGCLLEWGLPLSMPYRSETIDGCTVHTYNDGDLIACFDENIPRSVVEAIARRQPLRAVFRDAGFTTSPEKINLTEIFKLLAPDTRVKVI